MEVTVEYGNGKDYWDYRGRLEYRYKGETFYTISPIPYYYRLRANLLELLLSVFESINPMNICDFGCGDGWYLKYLSDKFPNSKHWIGVDLSETMIRRARELCPGADFFVSGNGITVGYSIDLIYSIFVFAHVMDDGKVLELFQNISAKLAPDGRFVIFEQTGPKRRQGENWCQRMSDEYVKLAEKCGMVAEKRRLIAFPFYRLFEKRITPYYYRFLSAGADYTERCMNANRSPIFRVMSSITLALSGAPLRPDTGKQEGNTFIVFKKDPR
jgi:SAM-dependent methyltransferase